MTLKAGLAGTISGILISILFFVSINMDAQYQKISIHYLFMAACLVIGGYAAALSAGPKNVSGRLIVGVTAGGQAGLVSYCLWGAALGTGVFQKGFPALINNSLQGLPNSQTYLTVIERTSLWLLAFLFVGILGGMLGGVLASVGNSQKTKNVETLKGPQMALNISITAVPASILAAALSAAVFIPSGSGGSHPGTILNVDILPGEWPLITSLVMTFISQLALLLVIPYETQKATHRCGLDEVKMAAYVCIAAFPTLFLLLFTIKGMGIILNLPALGGLILTAILSLMSLYILLMKVLPKRTLLEAPSGDRQLAEAKWFGTIAGAHEKELVMLCIGCGWAMVLPVYGTVFAVLINLLYITSGLDFISLFNKPEKLFITHGVVSMGLFIMAAVILTAIYLFYLRLGRRYSRHNNTQH